MEVLRVFQSHMKSTRGVELSLPTQRAVLRQPRDQGKVTMPDNLNFSFKAIYLSLIIVAAFYLWVMLNTLKLNTLKFEIPQI